MDTLPVVKQDSKHLWLHFTQGSLIALFHEVQRLKKTYAILLMHLAHYHAFMQQQHLQHMMQHSVVPIEPALRSLHGLPYNMGYTVCVI